MKLSSQCVSGSFNNLMSLRVYSEWRRMSSTTHAVTSGSISQVKEIKPLSSRQPMKSVACNGTRGTAHNLKEALV